DDGHELGQEYKESEESSGSGDELDPYDPNFSDNFKKPFVKKPDMGTLSDFKDELEAISSDSYGDTQSYIDYNESNDTFDSEYIDKRTTCDEMFRARTPKYLPFYFYTVPKNYTPPDKIIGHKLNRDKPTTPDPIDEYIPTEAEHIFKDPVELHYRHNRLLDRLEVYDEGFQKFIMENHRAKEQVDKIERGEITLNISTTKPLEYVEIQPQLNRDFKRYRLIVKMFDSIMNQTKLNVSQLSRNHVKMYNKLKHIVSEQKYVRAKFYRLTIPPVQTKASVKTTRFYMKYLKQNRPFQELLNATIALPDFKRDQKVTHNYIDSFYEYLMS
ncbi:Hypothetical predicted protein, partial [Olea europaea subsp. europaea]